MKLFIFLLLAFLPLWIGLIDIVLWFFGVPFSIVNWNQARFFVTIVWVVIGWIVAACFSYEIGLS